MTTLCDLKFLEMTASPEMNLPRLNVDVTAMGFTC